MSNGEVFLTHIPAEFVPGDFTYLLERRKAPADWAEEVYNHKRSDVKLVPHRAPVERVSRINLGPELRWRTFERQVGIVQWHLRNRWI